MAFKSYDDYYYKNSYYSKTRGVSIEEFSSLKLECLINYVDFGFYIDNETHAL